MSSEKIKLSAPLRDLSTTSIAAFITTGIASIPASVLYQSMFRSIDRKPNLPLVELLRTSARLFPSFFLWQAISTQSGILAGELSKRNIVTGNQAVDIAAAVAFSGAVETAATYRDETRTLIRACKENQPKPGVAEYYNNPANCVEMRRRLLPALYARNTFFWLGAALASENARRHNLSGVASLANDFLVGAFCATFTHPVVGGLVDGVNNPETAGGVLKQIATKVKADGIRAIPGGWVARVASLGLFTVAVNEASGLKDACSRVMYGGSEAGRGA